MKTQKAKAIDFRSMHQSGDVLVLANAWDVPSARIFEQAGFGAIGTTSAGIAISLGYPDGERISRDEMLQVVARIARSVSIPVTADMEAGYGAKANDVAETAKRVIAARERLGSTSKTQRRNLRIPSTRGKNRCRE